MLKKNPNLDDNTHSSITDIIIDHEKMDLIAQLRSIRMQIRQSLGSSLMRFVDRSPFLQKCRETIADIVNEFRMLYDKEPIQDEQFRSLKCMAALEVVGMPGVRDQLQPLFDKQQKIKHELRTKHDWKMPRPFDG